MTRPLAYFITFHTYGSWLHGQAKGSVDPNHCRFGEPVLAADGSVRRYNGITGEWNRVEADDGTIFHAAPWYNNSTQGHNVHMRWLPVN